MGKKMENEIVLHQHFLFDVVGSSSLPNELQGIKETTTEVVVDDVASKVEAIWKLRFFIIVANQCKWASDHRNYVVWVFFQLNGEEVGGIIDPKLRQMMQCMFCHHVASSSSSHNASCTTCCKKGLLQYTLTHGTTSIKKHIKDAHEVDLKQCMT
jgi:hypothetical protein